MAGQLLPRACVPPGLPADLILTLSPSGSFLGLGPLSSPCRRVVLGRKDDRGPLGRDGREGLLFWGEAITENLLTQQL